MGPARCPKCGVKGESDGRRMVIVHGPKCPRQSQHERIEQLEQELRGIRYAVNHVLGGLGS